MTEGRGAPRLLGRHKRDMFQHHFRTLAVTKQKAESGSRLEDYASCVLRYVDVNSCLSYVWMKETTGPLAKGHLSFTWFVFCFCFPLGLCFLAFLLESSIIFTCCRSNREGTHIFEFIYLSTFSSWRKTYLRRSAQIVKVQLDKLSWSDMVLPAPGKETELFTHPEVPPHAPSSYHLLPKRSPLS